MKDDRFGGTPTPSSTLTRRQLLRRLGAVGGSTLVLGAMDAWGLKGQAAPSRPELSGTPREGSVLVLGAGLGGLIAAYELGKLGYDVQILEARDHVGGLCWTVRRGDSHTEVDGGPTQVCDFDEGLYFNAGAWRIPHADEGILGYCKELGVPLEIFVNVTDANYFYDEDPALGELAGQRVRVREAKADLWGGVTELLAKAADAGEIDTGLSEEDEEALVSFLVRAGYLDSEDFVYRPPEMRGSDTPWDFTALLKSGFESRVRSLYATTGGPDPVFQPVGGMMQIPLAFERALGDRIRFGSEVVRIVNGEDEVRVVSRNAHTGRETEDVADYCVIALPMAVLQRIEVNLSDEMQEAVDSTSHSNSAKMGLQMARRFWEEDDGIFGGHLFARSLDLGEFSYPSNDYFTEKGVLLGYYGSGSTADLDQKSLAERVEHVLTQASKVHPQMRAEFETAYSVWWDKVPYSLGAYGRTPADETLSVLGEPDGRIFIGSAGASDRPAWMEGAVHAAWRTVENVHARAMGAE